MVTLHPALYTLHPALFTWRHPSLFVPPDPFNILGFSFLGGTP